MKRRSTLFYALALIGVLAVASILSAMTTAAPAAIPPARNAAQVTVIVTVPPTIQSTPPVVVVTGTGVIVPTGAAPAAGSWLFLAILIIAGLAFLVAIFALMRRPYP